MIQIRTFSAS